MLDNALRRVGGGEVISPLHVFATYARKGDLSRTLLDRPMTIEPVFAWQAPKACAFANDHNGEHCRAKYGVEPGSVDRDPTLQADQARADASGRLKIIGYQEMPADPDQLAVVLASGEAIYAAFRVDVGLWSNLRGGAGRAAYYPEESAPTGHAWRWRLSPGAERAAVPDAQQLGPRTGHETLRVDRGEHGRTHLMNAYRVEAVAPRCRRCRATPAGGGPLPVQGSWGSARDAVSQLCRAAACRCRRCAGRCGSGNGCRPGAAADTGGVEGLDAWLRAATAAALIRAARRPARALGQVVDRARALAPALDAHLAAGFA